MIVMGGDDVRSVPIESSSLRCVGLFGGIGGLELGLTRAGHSVEFVSENWEPAARVLRSRFPQLELAGDVAAVDVLPEHDLLAAGFPCTDLSPSGLKAGIGGTQTGLVSHVFRLLGEYQPTWVLLENVPNLLRLHGGEAMRYVTSCLESLGYRWAYRTVDSRFTGLPQRRRRVIVLASRTENPEKVLLSQEALEGQTASIEPKAFGFYWTEGRGGLGWAADAVPTIKGGSTIGINSAPAVWLPGAEPGRKLVIPSAEDGERLQGFPAGWTEPALDGGKNHRWKLIGNAVTVEVAEWVGTRLSSRVGDLDILPQESISCPPSKWPLAAFGANGRMWASTASEFPERRPYQHLEDFLRIDEAEPLSHRASMGFLRRLDVSRLRLEDGFLSDVEEHVRLTREPLPSAGSNERRDQTGWASSPDARNRMRANKSKDTKPELRLRRALFARGLRYRIQTRPEPDIRARVDVVHRPTKTAVEVRGCFWHACPEHATQPKANREYWIKKLARNVARDAEIAALLEDRGWHLEIVWEHADVDDAADRIMSVISARRSVGNARDH